MSDITQNEDYSEITIDNVHNAFGDTLNSLNSEVQTIEDQTQYAAEIINQNTYRLAALMVAGLTLTQAARSIGARHHEAKSLTRTMEFKIETLRLLSLAREEAAAGAIATKAGRLMELANMAEDLRTIKDRRAEACDPRNMPSLPAFWEAHNIPQEEAFLMEGLGENFDPTATINPALMPTSIRVPGAETGLLTRKFKVIGRGLDTRTIEEWEVDTSLQRGILDIHERVARELGQWSEKREIEFTQKMYVGIAIDDI